MRTISMQREADEALTSFVPDDLSAFWFPTSVHPHAGPDRGVIARGTILLKCDQQFVVRHAQVQVSREAMIDNLLDHGRNRIRYPLSAVARGALDGDGFGPERHRDLAADWS